MMIIHPITVICLVPDISCRYIPTTEDTLKDPIIVTNLVLCSMKVRNIYSITMTS